VDETLSGLEATQVEADAAQPLLSMWYRRTGMALGGAGEDEHVTVSELAPTLLLDIPFGQVMFSTSPAFMAVEVVAA
jgi:hypothetical protein